MTIQLGDWMAQYGAGRCINCGFLAKAGYDNNDEHSRTNEIEEVPFVHREHGNIRKLRDGYPAQPICFIQKFLLFGEMLQEALQDGLQPGQTVPVVQMHHVQAVIKREDRKCDGWTRYVEHLPPQWHWEHKRMLDLKKLDEAAERRAFRTNLVLGVVGAVMATGQLLLGIAAYRFTANQPTLPVPLPVVVAVSTPSPSTPSVSGTATPQS